MSHRWLQGTVSALLIVSAGCYMHPQETRDEGPLMLSYAIDDREAYARILRSIVAVDLNVDLKDADAGIVKTEYHTLEYEHVGCGGIGLIQRRARFIIVAAHGACSIKGESQQHFVGGTVATGPAPFTDERGLTDGERAIMKGLAKRIESDLAAK